MSYSSPQDGWQQPQGAPPGDNPYGQQYAQDSQATTALIVSIVGLVCCQLASPVGLYLGKKEVDAIDQGLSDPAERGKAQVAYIVGIVGSVLLGLAFLVVFLQLIF